TRETVDDKSYRHGDHHSSGRDGAPTHDGNDLGRSLQHSPHYKYKKDHRKNAVHQPDLPAIAVFNNISYRGPVAPAVKRSNQPIKRCDQHIFPLVPDRGKTQTIGYPGLCYGHFGVGSGTKCLAHHHPPLELSVTPEIIVAAFDLPGNPKSEGNDTDEVNNQDNVVDSNHRSAICGKVANIREYLEHNRPTSIF